MKCRADDEKLILAIESSCDETSAAVVKGGREVVSLVISSQIAIHEKYGGVVPEIASRKHVECIVPVVQEALDEAHITLKDLDAIAVTKGPGLVGALLVGVSYPKALALAAGLPLIGVHHIEGHICANFITDKTLEPPFCCLIVSGGHTEIVDVPEYCRYDLVAATSDDAAGEAFDKGARLMGLGYPGGVKLDKMSQGGDPTAFTFPRAKVRGDELAFSFSGLKTAIRQTMAGKSEEFIQQNMKDICASYQAAIVDVLCDHSIEACQRLGRDRLVLAGGVSANSRLRTEMVRRAQEKGIRVSFPEPILCTDNAAMIGAAAFLRLKRSEFAGMDLNAAPYLPLA